MKSNVTATIEFYFKGEKFTPSIRIDLSEYLQLNNSFPNLCALIATDNQIDHYSYEYEMMQSQVIQYTKAEGLITKYIVDGELNIDDFLTAWQENKILQKLVMIAESYMDVKNLEQHPELQAALLEAYKLGKLEL